MIELTVGLMILALLGCGMWHGWFSEVLEDRRRYLSLIECECEFFEAWCDEQLAIDKEAFIEGKRDYRSRFETLVHPFYHLDDDLGVFQGCPNDPTTHNGLVKMKRGAVRVKTSAEMQREALFQGQQQGISQQQLLRCGQLQQQQWRQVGPFMDWANHQGSYKQVIRNNHTTIMKRIFGTLEGVLGGGVFR